MRRGKKVFVLAGLKSLEQEQGMKKTHFVHSGNSRCGNGMKRASIWRCLKGKMMSL